ncbi:MAG: 30S ribosomal protein S6 [Endomicrobiaceae bacterium]
MSYECTFICSPELDSAKIEEITSKASKIIEAAGGTVKNLQQLGKKKLAYNVKKFREGIYVYMELNGSGSMVSSLETFFKVNDSIIRFLTIKVEPKKKAAEKKTIEKTAEEVKDVKTEISNESAELPTATAE